MFELTQRQIEQFNEDGFLIVDKLIDEATADALHERYERMFRGEFESGIRPDEVNWREGESDPSLTRQICNGWKGDRLLASVVLREDLGRAVATLGGWSGARVMQDNVLWKPPGTRPLGYHQDNAYLSWFRPGEIMTCWIALDETHADAGTIEFARGSHKWAQLPPEGEFHGPTEYRKYMEQAAAREGVEPDIVYVEVPKGGGSFHHGRMWHGSGNNTAKVPRRSLVLHAMPAAAEYNSDHLDAGIGPIYGRYKRLADDVMDENYFPILWRDDGYRSPVLDMFISGK
ncbi:MAG: phytanoyl-CoA dioxygenase family protein [Rhodospirillales bacterium]